MAAGIRRILVVDDDDAIREEVAATLGMDPALDVSMAKDGRVALHQIATGRFWPDVILLDVMMPGVDGGDFLAALDAINHTKDVAVIVMTALPESRIPDGLHRRARSILFKPFTLATLAESLDAALTH
jgi:DNA-binding response OmpR family regulator